MEYLWKPGQVGTQPDLTYGCPSLGPSMKSCFLNIKPFPEFHAHGTAGLVESACSAVGNRLRILFLCRGRLSLELVASWNLCPSRSRPAAAACL